MVDGQGVEKSCKSIIGDLTKRQLTGIAACAKSIKFKNGKDKSKKMNVRISNISLIYLKHDFNNHNFC